MPSSEVGEGRAGQLPGLLERGPLHDDAELVAGQAAHEVARARGGGRHQGVRDALERAVAGVVARPRR